MLTKITQEVFDSILNDPDKNFEGYIIGKDITFPERISNRVFTNCKFELPLEGINFMNVKFNYVDHSLYNLTNCTLRYCNFSYCNLKIKSFIGCKFVGTDFNFCDISGSLISKCSMTDVNFMCSDLAFTVFNDVNGKYTQFCSCEMDKCSDINSNIIFPRHVPSEGSFIAWKKANAVDETVIIKLRIPEDAKRFCANNKCRADKVEVLGFETLDGEKLPDDTIVHSFWNPLFKYHIGFIEICKFNDDPQVECGGGIHFFLSREDAVNYVF